MGKQKALEYAEAKLERAIQMYEEYEEDYGENLEDVYESIADMGNSADAYEKGDDHGRTAKTIDLMHDIIALLKQDDA